MAKKDVEKMYKRKESRGKSEENSKRKGSGKLM